MYLYTHEEGSFEKVTEKRSNKLSHVVLESTAIASLVFSLIILGTELLTKRYSIL